MSDYASRVLREQFGTATLDGFGLTGKSAAIGASGAMIHYVRQTQKTTLEHITGLSYSESANYLVLDAATIRNLELFESSGGDTKDTLLGVINRTRPAWVRACCGIGSCGLPSMQRKSNRVSMRSRSSPRSAMLLEQTRTSFEGMFDLERLLGKITVGTASPRELTSLRSFYRTSASDCEGARSI